MMIRHDELLRRAKEDLLSVLDRRGPHLCRSDLLHVVVELTDSQLLALPTLPVSTLHLARGICACPMYRRQLLNRHTLSLV